MNPQETTYQCQECNREVPKGKYCPTCGLYNFGKRATVMIFITNALSQILSLEKGLFFNFKVALQKPKELVWTYYEGIRRKYASPGRFILYTLFLLGLLYFIFPESSFFNLTFEEESADSITTNKFFLFFIIPLLTITSKIVFWRKVSGIAIHVISMVYIILPRFIITLILLIIFNQFTDSSIFYLILILTLLLSIFWSNTCVFLSTSSFFKKVGFTLLQFAVVLIILLVILFGFALLESASFEFTTTD